MNLSIANLRVLTNNSYLSLSTSPLLIHNHYIKFNIFRNILLNFLISTFLYSSTSSLTGSNLIVKSHFKNFLKAPIEYHSEGSILKIQDDIFENCKERAINIKENITHAIITHCIFNNCRISKNGGAIFSKSETFECHFCCFYRCTTVFEGWWGSAIYVMNSNFSNISQITVFQCPPPQQESRDMDSQVTIFKGTADCRYHNYTQGRHRFSSGIRLSHTDENSIVRFVVTNLHKSGNAMSFVRCYFKGDFSYINFVNNNCSLGVIYLYMTDIQISNSFFIKNNGDIPYFYADAKIALVSCIIDKKNINSNEFIEILNCTFKNSIEVKSFEFLLSCKNYK